jgi:hypothetical protein
VPRHRLQIRGDVRVNGEGDIKEDDLANAFKRFGGLGSIAGKMLQKFCVNERKITAVGPKIELGRHSDALVAPLRANGHEHS